MKLQSIIWIPLLALCLLAGCVSHESVPGGKEELKVTGNWEWAFTTPTGETREVTLNLFRVNGKLMGTIISQGTNAFPIENATLEGDRLSFTVTRERDGKTITSKYSGRVEGNVIIGKIEGAFGDQTQARDWKAKRAKVVIRPGAAK
jgi:hypothetical protein